MHRVFRATIAVILLAAWMPWAVARADAQEPGPWPREFAPLHHRSQVPESGTWGTQFQAAGDLGGIAAPPSAALVGQSGTGSNPVQPGGAISGTVTDTNGDVVGQANVVLSGPDFHAAARTNSDGDFAFGGLKAGGPYRVTIQAKGFDDWVSPPVTLAQGEYAFVKEIRLKISSAVTSVTVTSSTVQIATEQVEIEEKQRIFGIIPNFYVVYDPANAAPMTAKLKFQMALRVSVDPVSFLGTAALAGIDQASDNPDYQQGVKGYAQRFGSVYADGFTDTMFGGAILPTILHQDPRYYYKGTGTVRARVLYALANAVVCKGDNGRWQFNYSGILGSIAAGGISNLYYPASDRSGAALTFENAGLGIAGSAAANLFQEFVIKKLTPKARKNASGTP